jgi:hypothetical protein
VSADLLALRPTVLLGALRGGFNRQTRHPVTAGGSGNLGGLLMLLIVGGMIVGEDTAPTTETGSSQGSEGRQKPPGAPGARQAGT